MMVMPSNSSAMLTGYLAGKYEGRLGWLMSPEGWREPHAWLPYALDNGAFSAYRHARHWDEAAFYAMLKRPQRHKPLWVLCPDKVADKDGTLALWKIHAPRIAERGHAVAFAVQDEMTPDDVPEEAAVIFIGGTTDWKWDTLNIWTASFPRVHVGRVNGKKGLWECHEAGVESCDGTGWFRGDKVQLRGLLEYLEESSNSAIA